MLSTFRDAGVQVAEFSNLYTEQQKGWLSSVKRDNASSQHFKKTKPNPTKQQTKHAFGYLSPISHLLNKSRIRWEESNLITYLKEKPNKY